jgi:hypothetical protein
LTIGQYPEKHAQCCAQTMLNAERQTRQARE